jgi:hypothetical protein
MARAGECSKSVSGEFVIPAKAGIQVLVKPIHLSYLNLDPRFREDDKYGISKYPN